jgi:Dipeptidyl peptidase IV (DPP IV) N-terminal region
MFKIILTVTLFLTAYSALAVDPTHNWKSVETDHFYIHFSEQSQVLASKAARIAENAHKKLSPVLDWVPEDKTHLVISDETDQPNGYAIPFPYNRSVLFIAPPDTTNTLEDYDDWLDTLITHEYTHILHLDKATGAASKLRKIFGRHFLLFPNIFQPAWFIEGLATHYETDEVQGIGRGQSSLFKMMMRAEVANGIKPVSQVNLRIRSWPMGTTAYLYGVHFYQFIEQRYGEQAVKVLIDNYSNNVIPFMINTNTKQIFKKNITELWSEFEEWLKQTYQPQIEDIERKGLTEGKFITQNGYFTGEVNSLSDNKTYYIRQGAFNYQALMVINAEGVHKEVIEIHRGARMDVHKDKGVLLAQPEYCDEYNRYYDLYIVDHDGNRLNKITECGRYRSASWSADGANILAVHTDKGISQLHILNARGEKQSVVWQGKDNEVIGQPDWSANGKYVVAAVFRPGTGWNIELFDIEKKKWDKITNDKYIDAQPEFNEKGDSFVFSSDRNGIYNIYRYELKQKTLTQLTKVKSGAFQPSQLNKRSPLYYVGYHSNGSDIARLKQANDLTNVEIEDTGITERPGISYQAVNINKETDYSPWSSLAPRWWFPYFFIDENQSELGFSTSGNDALGIHNYFIQAAYDTENQYSVGQINYSYSNRLQLGMRRSTDIFLDSNGNFSRARKDDDAFIALMFPYTQEKYRWNFIFGAFTSKTSDARLAPLESSAADFEDNLLGAAITFDNPRRYIRSISANDGRSVRLIAESSDLIDSDFSGEVYTLDWREYLPLGGQHVLALRLAEGYGTKQPEPFVLGGEENNFEVIDVILNSIGGDPLFGRREYALRGYDEGHVELIGRRMQLASMEWRFPLDLVERGYMSPPLGLIQYSGSLFADTGATWQAGHSPDKYYTGVGLELHADVSLFYGLNIRMRLGVAKGLDKIIGDERAYFSLGASF